jgi:hypothetical protein
MLAFKPAPASALTPARAQSGDRPGAPAKRAFVAQLQLSMSTKFAVDRPAAGYNM